MAKKKEVVKEPKEVPVKDTTANVAAVVKKFAALSPEDRIKLAPKLSTAANQDANLKSTGNTENVTTHYDDITKDEPEEEK